MSRLQREDPPASAGGTDKRPLTQESDLPSAPAVCRLLLKSAHRPLPTTPGARVLLASNDP